MLPARTEGVWAVDEAADGDIGESDIGDGDIGDGDWLTVPDDVLARWPQVRPAPPRARDAVRWTLRNPRRLGLWLAWSAGCLVASAAVDLVLPSWLAYLVGAAALGAFATLERRVWTRLTPPAAPVRRRVVTGDLDGVPDLTPAQVRRARRSARVCVGLLAIAACAAGTLACLDGFRSQRGELVLTALAGLVFTPVLTRRSRADVALGERRLVEVVGFCGRVGEIVAVRPLGEGAEALLFTAARSRERLVLGDLLVCDGLPLPGQLVRLWSPHGTWFSCLADDPDDALAI